MIDYICSSVDKKSQNLGFETQISMQKKSAKLE